MDLPQSREEALAKGFKPVENLDALIHEFTGLSADAYFQRKAAELVAVVNCNDPAKAGKPCGTILGPHGQIIIQYCQGGSCGRDTALVGAAK